MNEWKQLLLYLYLCILEGEKLELAFSNFLTIKKLELDFTKRFKHDKNKSQILDCLLKPGKKKGAYGMSTLLFLKTATKKQRAESN